MLSSKANLVKGNPMSIPKSNSHKHGGHKSVIRNASIIARWFMNRTIIPKLSLRLKLLLLFVALYIEKHVTLLKLQAYKSQYSQEPS